MTPAGKTVYDKRLPNTEPEPRALFEKKAARFGSVLIIVDQPASIGASAVLAGFNQDPAEGSSRTSNRLPSRPPPPTHRRLHAMLGDGAFYTPHAITV